MRCPVRLSGMLAMLLIAAGVTRPAHAQDPITWRSFDCGGVAFVTAGNYKLGGTIGQPDAGRLAGGAFTLRGGFWLGGRVPVNDAGGNEPPALVFRFLRSP